MHFTIYSKTSCPYCTKIKMVMEMAKLDHLIYVLGDHFQEQDFRDQFGKNATFPQVMMGDVHLGGCVDTIKYLTINKII